MLWTIAAEVGLYSSFALLIGTLLMASIPEARKPEILLSRRWMQLASLGAAVFSAAPVLELASRFYESDGFYGGIVRVIKDFQIGQIWALSLVLIILFYLFITFAPVFQETQYRMIALFFVISLIFAVSVNSHTASLSPYGAIYHAVHMILMSVWTGILLQVSWFSKNSRNWLSFLKWFSPVAMISVGLIIFTGFLLMTLLMNVAEYPQTWSLNYGQYLLIKHLIVIPVLIFAFMNSFYIKSKLRKGSSLDPRKWTKAESAFLLLVFPVTGVLGQSEPPHNIEVTKATDGLSPLFTLFSPDETIAFGPGVMSALFGVLALLFAALLIMQIRKNAPAVSAFAIGLLFTVSSYLFIMTSI
ncbi:copper resistance protein CopD [Bacillus mangrovi]|uniref:Copper resistance protein CopD n=1 Tax=Metabacillus mangrovi TaxID=1491830 RepID=A0A7X2S4I5_9BACI|nr:CopD family protein [Metabacillus mangrovi]MTH53553.1 copper resistance protein CopD [Metabacillus mangrovi]